MTEFEAAILDFAEAREQGQLPSTVVVFGISPTRYTQLLLALIDRPDVEAARPLLAHRLRRVSEQRATARAVRTFRCVG